MSFLDPFIIYTRPPLSNSRPRSQMLQYDPADRVTPEEALRHPFLDGADMVVAPAAEEQARRSRSAPSSRRGEAKA